MTQLVRHLRSRVDAPVAHSWIELAEPTPLEAAKRLAAEGIEEIVLVPLLAFQAHHAGVDLPGNVRAIERAFPALAVRAAAVLGLDERLVALAARKVGPARDRFAGLLVVSSGSTDPSAQQSAADAAWQLANATGHGRYAHAFAAGPPPTAADALRRLANAGAKRVSVFSWSLLAGRLDAVARERASAAAEPLGLTLVDAGRFGPDPVVADVLVDRYRAALGR